MTSSVLKVAVLVETLQPLANDNIKGYLPTEGTRSAVPSKRDVSFPGGTLFGLGRWPFWKMWRQWCYSGVVSSRHHPSPSHSVVGVLAESLATTFQNNSVSSHFHCYDSSCCLWRWGQAPVSFMRVTLSSHINLVFLMSLPLWCFQRPLPLFS